MARHAARWRMVAVSAASAYLIVLLVVGLDPRDPIGLNDLSWPQNGPGIRFAGHGLAYAGPLSRADLVGPAGEFTVLVEFEIVPAGSGRGFEHVVTFFGDSARTQLLIGQWRESLIVMNGADYDYRGRLPRLTVPVEDGADDRHLLAVTSGVSGTRAFLDGVERGLIPEPLTFPADHGSLRLLLGNSVHGNQGWTGVLKGVAVVPRALDRVAAGRMADRMRRGARFDQLGLQDPVLMFAFPPGQEGESPLLGGNQATLHFPEDGVLLEPEFFRSGFEDPRLADMLLNLLGFVPFGLLCAGSVCLGGQDRLVAVVVSTALGVTLSASMELAQAWMPMRSSSILDLLLNGVGTLTGAIGIFVLPIPDRAAQDDS